MKKTLFVVCLLATVVLFMPSAEAVPFTNGSFEQGTNPPVSYTTLLAGSTDLTGWGIGGHSIDWIGSYWNAYDGTKSIDLNGLGPGSIYQTFDTVNGQTYEVKFMLAGNDDGLPVVKTLIGYANNIADAVDFSFNTTGNSNSSMGWTEYGFSFTASGSSSTLFFESNTSTPNFSGIYPGNPFGPALDDVRVSAVPEASAILLLGSGLVGLVGYRRMKRMM